MSDTNPDLAAQEVDDELRRDQMNALWKAYGKYIVGGAVGIVLAVGGTQLYKYQVRSSQEASSVVFSEAASKAATEGVDAATTWSEAKQELSGGYAALAELRAADALAASGETDAAVAAYDAVADGGAGDEVLRQYAKLAAALLILDEKGDLDGARARLVVLAGPEEPWRYSASEQLAFIDMKQGDVEAAYERFAGLADDTTTPATIAGRARQFRDMLELQLPGNTATAGGDVNEG